MTLGLRGTTLGLRRSRCLVLCATGSLGKVRLKRLNQSCGYRSCLQDEARVAERDTGGVTGHQVREEIGTARSSPSQPFRRSDNVQARAACRARGQIVLQEERWGALGRSGHCSQRAKLVCEAAFTFRESLRRSAAPSYLRVPLPAKLTAGSDILGRLRLAGCPASLGGDPLRSHSRREDIFIGGVEEIGRGAQARLCTSWRAGPV